VKVALPLVLTHDSMKLFNKTKLFLSVFLLAGFSMSNTHSYAKDMFYIQNLQETRGLVTDELSNPIRGASVKNLTTGISTQTDENGFFSLTMQMGESIQISSMGFDSQIFIYDQQEKFVLSSNSSNLDEIIVVGYGTQKKVNLSGAVDYISGKQLESRPINNVGQGLQGMVPNLNVQFNSGAPGEAAKINIRGITSINGGDPLILVDNVPITSEQLNRIAPQDIESFSVIKDASAAAIYGARASFGVILITTKSGKGDLKINYSNNFTFNTPTVIPDKITDPYIFSRLLETSTDNTPWDNVNFSEQYYQYAKERSDNPNLPDVRVDPSNPKQWEYMGNRDWTRYFMSDWNNSSNHDLSISGSSDKVNYYLSSGYNRQNSPIKIADDYFDRYNVRSKVNYRINDYISVGNNTILGLNERVTPSQVEMSEIFHVFPTSVLKNPDGSWAYSDVQRNVGAGRIAAKMVDGGQSRTKFQDLQSTFNAELRLFDNKFRINADYTFQRNSTNYNWYTTKYKIGYGPDDIREEGESNAFRQAGFSYYNIYNIFGTYNQTFDKHQVTAVLGFNQEDFREEKYHAEKKGLISDLFPTIALATGASDVGERIDKYALRGAFYRLNYIYDDKYIVEFNGRYDGSSRFPKDSRFGFFPSGSVAWLLNKENFLSDVNWLSQFKIRASYGDLGNQSVTNFGYFPTMQPYISGYLIDGKLTPSIKSPGLVSNNYTWEKVRTYNLGFDFGILQNKLSGSFDIYRRNTLGMLTYGRELPKILGVQEPNENAADLATNGWELSLSYNDSKEISGSMLNFGARFMLSDSYSKITKFDNPNKRITQFYEGMRMGEIWGLESDGLFKDAEEISKLDQTSIIPWGALSIVPGWPKFVDQDKNGKIEKGYELGNTKDLKVIGNSTPRFNFGLDMNASWKGFDIRAFFQGIGKRDYYPLDYLYWGVYQQPYGNIYTHLLDFYRPTSDSEADRAKHSASYLALGLADQNLDAKYPILQSWLADLNLGTRVDQSQGAAIPQTRYLLNAAYLRFKNLTIGYTLPNSWVEKAKVKNFRIYVSAENLMEWSAVKRYFDPEVLNINTYTDPNKTRRREGNGVMYPFQRSFSAGLQLNF
jgi:TonB-linked SusC/RagA family outer membrane protein